MGQGICCLRGATSEAWRSEYLLSGVNNPLTGSLCDATNGARRPVAADDRKSYPALKLEWFWFLLSLGSTTKARSTRQLTRKSTRKDQLCR